MIKTKENIYKLVFIFYFLIQIPAIGQENELDSIRNLVESYKNKDSIRVDLLINLTEYFTTRDINRNLALINEAIEIADKIDYKKGKGAALNALSSYYIVKGNYEAALTNALESKAIIEQIGDQRKLIDVHNNLARIYNVTGKYSKSLSIQLENIDLVKNDPASPSKAKFYFYAAKTYEYIDNLEEAENYYLQALNISAEANFLTGIAIAEGSLGNVYNSQGNYLESIKYLNNTLDFANKHNQTSNIAASYFTLADSYRGIGNYLEAVKLNSKSIKIYEDLGNYRMLNSAYLHQYQFYEALKEYKNANKFLVLHYTMVDTLFSETKTKAIEELQTKYETGKKEAEIESLSQQSKIQSLQLSQQKYMLAGSAMLFLFLVSGGIFFYKQRQIRQKQAFTSIELKEAKKRIVVEQQSRESELKAIRSQINPHFMFNALNSIQEYIMTNEKKLAGKYLGKFADLMRIYLEHSQSKSISVNEEIETLTLYLELEELRFEDTLKFTLNVDDNVDSHLLSIPTLLIQPYVENALKHGLLHKKENRKLSISFRCVDEGKVLACEIADNGVGRKKAEEINKMRNPGHKSFATSATKSRLELLNYNIENKITVETVDLEDEQGNAIGTKVILSIPV